MNGAEAVDGPPQRVDHAADQRRPDGDLEHAGRATHLVALAQLQVVSENDRANVVFLEIQRESGDLVARRGDRELEHLARHRRREAVDAGDAVLHLEDRADLANVDVREVCRLNFLEEEVLELAGSQDGVGGHGSTGLSL